MEMRFYNPATETTARFNLDLIIDERVRYTLSCAALHSPFISAGSVNRV